MSSSHDTSEPESVLVGHEPCPSCGSRDNLGRYSDGHGYCFGCRYHEHGDGSHSSHRKRSDVPVSLKLVPGEPMALRKRGITEETCRKFNYTTGTFKNQPVQIANFRSAKDGAVVAQKLRFAGKDFLVRGETRKAGLFGQHLWRERGKYIIITEGEIDALTVSQIQGNKWPVVSVLDGAQSAKKELKHALEWLLGFDTIVLFFDNDEVGQKAATECAPLFPPGRVKIARMESYKDPSEALMNGDGKAITEAFWNASTFRPDGIIPGLNLWDSLTTQEPQIKSVPYPWPTLNEKTRGLRRGELVTVTAGSGIGKSTLVRQVAHHLLKSGETLGLLMLEENIRRTALGLMAIEAQSPFHLDITPWASLSGEAQALRKQAYDATLGTGRVFLYDHFGSTDIENLLYRIRYLAQGCECGWIILDHLSIVVSGLDDGDERKTIDRTMTHLRTLVEETGIGLLLVSHLRRPEGKGHEQGAVTSLSQLRGSHAIAQLSDMVIGAERDQQGEDPNTLFLRVLKNRFSGETGRACSLTYDLASGLLNEASPFSETEELSPF